MTAVTACDVWGTERLENDDLLGIRDPTTALPIIDPDARRRRLSALVKAVIVAPAAPAIYVIEDVHWIDDASDAMLADFMTVVPQTHAMVLLTHRPEFHGAVTGVPGAQTLTLAPLSNPESAALANQLLGADPSVSELASTIPPPPPALCTYFWLYYDCDCCPAGRGPQSSFRVRGPS